MPIKSSPAKQVPSGNSLEGANNSSAVIRISDFPYFQELKTTDPSNVNFSLATNYNRDYIMVKLSEDENRIIDGEAGQLKQVAMQNVVRYAEVLGAQSLCEVTKATVFCGAHHYLDACKSEDFDVVFSRMNMASDQVLTFDTTYNNCYIQSCVSPCDQRAYKPFGQSKAFFEKNW